MRGFFLLALLFFASSAVVLAQNVVSGKIIDSKTNAPLAGVSVRVKSTKKGTTTNNEGIFKIQANPTDVLEISAIGYRSQSVSINNMTDISITFEQISTDLGEVVVVGSRGAPRVRT